MDTELEVVNSGREPSWSRLEVVNRGWGGRGGSRAAGRTIRWLTAHTMTLKVPSSIVKRDTSLVRHGAGGNARMFLEAFCHHPRPKNTLAQRGGRDRG